MLDEDTPLTEDNTGLLAVSETASRFLAGLNLWESDPCVISVKFTLQAHLYEFWEVGKVSQSELWAIFETWVSVFGGVWA